jgi:uroporphyrinogen decarboxylase
MTSSTKKHQMQSSRETFLAAAKGEPTDFTPVWFMRQAGRYLPRYRELRKEHSILGIAKTPKLCKEVTLMPLRELGVDAAVMFADIMLPLEGMGVNFHIEENLGPVIHAPIRDFSSAESLKEFDPKAHVPFVLEAIRFVKSGLEQSKAALVGFSGAPFTIASYLIEGQPSRDFTKTKNLMFNDRETWRLLMTKLSDMVSDYLCAQIESGVDAVQLFDSWVGALAADDYEEYVAPYTANIFRRVKKEHPNVPRIHFGTNTAHLLKQMKKAGGDVFSIDWRIPIKTASTLLGSRMPIQGNLEPAVLLSKERNFIAKRVQQVLNGAKDLDGHIFNLGHGILRDTPVENAKYVVDYVHSHN